MRRGKARRGVITVKVFTQFILSNFLRNKKSVSLLATQKYVWSKKSNIVLPKCDEVWNNSFQNVLFRSLLHCGTLCSLTYDCTAFSYSKGAQICQLGSKGNSQLPKSSTAQSLVTSVFTRPGKICKIIKMCKMSEMSEMSKMSKMSKMS